MTLSDARFRALRLEVLARDHHTCQTCGSPTNEVDHVRPVTMGGADSLANMRAACRSCNARKWAHAVGPLVDQGDDPDCTHCRIGKRRGNDGLCQACADYVKRRGFLPPDRVVELRLERLVAATNPGGEWWVGGAQGVNDRRHPGSRHRNRG